MSTLFKIHLSLRAAWKDTSFVVFPFINALQLLGNFCHSQQSCRGQTNHRSWRFEHFSTKMPEYIEINPHYTAALVIYVSVNCCIGLWCTRANAARSIETCFQWLCVQMKYPDSLEFGSAVCSFNIASVIYFFSSCSWCICFPPSPPTLLHHLSS